MQFQIALAKSQREKVLFVFLEYTLMQRILIQQSVNMMDEKYLSSMRNIITRQLPNIMQDILLHLFRIYGKVKPKYVRAKNEKWKRICTIFLIQSTIFLLNQIFS